MPPFKDSLDQNPIFGNLNDDQKEFIRHIIRDEKFVDRLIENMTWEIISDTGIIACISIIDMVKEIEEGNEINKNAYLGPLQYLLGVTLALGMKPFTDDPTLFASRVSYILENPIEHINGIKSRIGL